MIWPLRLDTRLSLKHLKTALGNSTARFPSLPSPVPLHLFGILAAVTVQFYLPLSILHSVSRPVRRSSSSSPV